MATILATGSASGVQLHLLHLLCLLNFVSICKRLTQMLS